MSSVSSLVSSSSYTDPNSYLNPTTEVTSSATKNLGVDDFLKLITVQLSNQDPLQPMEDTQFIAQMASFTSLEQMQTLSKDFANFAAYQQQASAQDYLGRTVEVSDSTSASGTVKGVVSKVTFDTGGALLTIDGKDYDAANILSVSSTPATSQQTSTSN